jgi:hypothetical protein
MSPGYRRQAGTVYGFVLDSLTLHPLANAIVRFDGDTTLQSVTDTLGQFERAGLGLGRHAVQAMAIGYRAVSDSLTVTVQHSLFVAARMSRVYTDGGPCGGLDLAEPDAAAPANG